jgi:hypothetical protein
MTGFSLFKHAVLRVFRNLDDALAISGLIWIGVMAVMVLATAYTPDAPVIVVDTALDQPVAALDAMPLLFIFGTNLFVLLASIWVAIEWHRFVLLGERPSSIIPPFRGALFKAYFGKSLLMTAIMFGATLCVVIVIMIITSLLGGLQLVPVLTLIIVGIFGMYAFYRVSPVLPAAALGKSLTLKEAWYRTEPHKKLIFNATVLMIFATVLLQIPPAFAGAGPFGIIVSLITGWMGLMVGVSLLSAIYELGDTGDKA